MTAAAMSQIAFGRYAGRAMKRFDLATAATAEKPALDDKQRVDRLALLADRLRRPDGLDRDTLERIEQLSGDE